MSLLEDGTVVIGSSSPEVDAVKVEVSLSLSDIGAVEVEASLSLSDVDAEKVAVSLLGLKMAEVSSSLPDVEGRRLDEGRSFMETVDEANCGLGKVSVDIKEEVIVELKSLFVSSVLAQHVS